MKRSQGVFSLSEMANAESEEEESYDSSFSAESQIARMRELGEMYRLVKKDRSAFSFLSPEHQQALDTLISIFVDNNSFLQDQESDGYDAASSPPAERERIPSSPTRDPEERSTSDEELSLIDDEEEIFSFDKGEIFNSLESPTQSARASLL